MEKRGCKIVQRGFWSGNVCLISLLVLTKIGATDELLTPAIEAGRGPVLGESVVSIASVKPPEHVEIDTTFKKVSESASDVHSSGTQESSPSIKEKSSVRIPLILKAFEEERPIRKAPHSFGDGQSLKSSASDSQERTKDVTQQETKESHTFSDAPKLDTALRKQLLILNRVLAEGNVRDLLRIFTLDVRLDAPGRPGVWGRGADLVFALQTLFTSKGRYSVITEEVIPLQLLHLKGSDDLGKDRFLLTRNAFPLTDEQGLVRGGKAVILWQLAPGLEQPRASGIDGKSDGSADDGKSTGLSEEERSNAFAGSIRNDATLQNEKGDGSTEGVNTGDSAESEGDDAKWQLLIRWWIWNDNEESSQFLARKGRGSLSGKAGRPLEKHRDQQRLSDTSIRALYRTLHDRWRSFSQTLTRGDLPGCLDFTSPDTVAMPPGNPSVRGGELRQLCEAFVQAGVTQQVEINEALLFKGTRIVPQGRNSSYTKIKYFVLENDAFKNSYAESNSTEFGKQVVFWELHPGNKDTISSPNDIPLHKSSLRWGWTIWNGNEVDIR